MIYTYRNTEYLIKLNGTHCTCPVKAQFKKFNLNASGGFSCFNESLSNYTSVSKWWNLCISFYRQQNLTLRYGARSTSDTSCKNDLYDQLMHLIDIILDGQKCYLESIRGTEKFDILFQQYEMERHTIIEPFCKCVAVHMFPLLYVVSSHWLYLVSVVTCYISSYSFSSPLVFCICSSFVLL